VRIDYINDQANKQGQPDVFKCNDGLSSPCSRTNVPFSMADRVRDISTVLDELPGWFEDRVDLLRVGVMGHSRGTVTALAAAGGSAPWRDPATPPITNCPPPPQPADNLCWPLVPELAEGDARVKAVMGLAIGSMPITRGVNLANVKVPTLLVAGSEDRTSPPATSQFALDSIASTQKELITIDDVAHRSFDSTYCDQTQAAGAIAQDKIVEVGNPESSLAILDLHTFKGIVVATAAPNSGKAVDYCSYPTFKKPTDITGLVKSLTGFEIAGPPGPPNVPTTGLDTDQVKQTVTELAVPFFDHALKPGR
jgi:predicted dienelactone hydrolase